MALRAGFWCLTPADANAAAATNTDLKQPPKRKMTKGVMVELVLPRKSNSGKKKEFSTDGSITVCVSCC